MPLRKLVYLYIICICLCGYFWHKSSQPSIGIIIDDTHSGERELAHRIKRAADNLGWKTSFNEKKGLDWTISLTPNQALIIKPINFSVPFYPSFQFVPYKKLAFKNVLATIADGQSEKFQGLYSLLSEGGFTKFYGVNDEPITTLQKHGISLVFHSDQIFESAAASAIIISDENSFVKEHFGDNVFYVTTDTSAEEIYQQIKHHVDTIHQNPEKAHAMAKNCHQIFVDRFSIEQQLLHILKKIQAHEKNPSHF